MTAHDGGTGAGRGAGGMTTHDGKGQSVEVVVCASCGKVAVTCSRPWVGPSWGHRPIDGRVYTTQCPDGCDAGLKRETFVRRAA